MSDETSRYAATTTSNAPKLPPNEPQDAASNATPLKPPPQNTATTISPTKIYVY